jgi:glycosyltransferase involved in cell wall biosynthesis
VANRRLLVVSYAFPPAGGIMVQRVLSFARHLPRHGFEVHVLSCRNPSVADTDPGLEKLVPPEVRRHTAFTAEPPFHWNKLAWRLMGGGGGGGNDAGAKPAPGPAGGLMSRAKEAVKAMLSPDAAVLWKPFALRKACSIIREHGIDTVLVTAPPFSLFLVGNEIKRRFPGVRLVSDFRDEWLRFMLTDFEFTSGDRMRRMAESIERDTVEGSDLVVAVTRASLDEIRSRYPGLPESRFALVPNGFDPALLGQATPPPAAGDKIVVTHNGTAYRTSTPAYYLDALDSLPEPVRSRIETRFIGRIAETERGLFQGRRAEVQLHGFLPQGEALRRMAETDYLLLTMTNDFSLPGKLFEYMASGRPILALSPRGGGGGPHPARDLHRMVRAPRRPGGGARAAREGRAGGPLRRAAQARLGSGAALRAPPRGGRVGGPAAGAVNWGSMRSHTRFPLAPILAAALSQGAVVPVDLSAVRPGPVAVDSAGSALTVRWPDEAGRAWTAEFSLDDAKPLIAAVSLGSNAVLRNVRPQYWASTGKRRGRAGFDEFFDFPGNDPNGTRRFEAAFKPTGARVRTVGDRVEVRFDGFRMGIFQGGVAYTFYPGSRLIRQDAVASTQEPLTAYLYDAGIKMAAPPDRVVAGKREVVSPIHYYDTDGHPRTSMTDGPDRTIGRVRHRALAAQAVGGSVVVFPPPHTYIAPRDYTTNAGYVWHHGWAGRGGVGEVALGIRQPNDDGAGFYYPWLNAPPGTEQRMGMFLLVSDRDGGEALDQALRFTNRDRFPALPGHKTLTSHWHWGYTIQALNRGEDWEPPFRQVLVDMGIDAAITSDFHGDGHPQDLTDLRLRELEAYYRVCRKQSDSRFLLIPSEEGNTHLGGHWAIFFPKQVLWFMERGSPGPLARQHPRYGTVYHVGSAEDVIEMVRRENGILYQTHPRTKSSFEYPDKVRNTDFFLDPHYIGAGWKAMPADPSQLRQGLRALRLLDDMNNWGLDKRLLAETDMFHIEHTHELYSHMNANYVRIGELPSFDNYGRMLDAVRRGDYFVSMGEVLLPEARIETGDPDSVTARVEARWTFPLAFGEIVWGDGSQTHTREFPLDTTRPFGRAAFEWKAAARGWKWARIAVWDIAGNGAFANPVRR